MQPEFPVATAPRRELPPMPPRIAALPVDQRGYPIPFFVAYPDGKPDFRLTDPEKLISCVTHSRCLVCGQKITNADSIVFVFNLTCAVTRKTDEPPCHRSCAEWSIRACPFMLMPKMKRAPLEKLPPTIEERGNSYLDNIGVFVLWECESFTVDDGFYFFVGDPVQTEFFAEGRPATEEEIEYARARREPMLREQCHLPEHHDQLDQMYAAFAEVVRERA